VNDAERAGSERHPALWKEFRGGAQDLTKAIEAFVNDRA
jgi:hypothetical protein